MRARSKRAGLVGEAKSGMTVPPLVELCVCGQGLSSVQTMEEEKFGEIIQIIIAG
jgi:hypothetical protein